MKSKDVIKRLNKLGWYIEKFNGSHAQLKHRIIKGKVTVPLHNKDLPKGTLNNILKQAGIKEKKS
ncbi:MAG: type II toxin-antitoxin system HicA family toxin [Anaerorhabdus sp.]|uniref:type II toxin-antitoxin system HicA family toxin n=1 Tax=Anaerorhabdus sp. TaxID=1872524 RepID=UPI003A880C6C